MAKSNLHNSRTSFELNGKTYNYYRLAALEEAGIANVSRLPYSIKVLLESVLRQHDGYVIKDDHVENLAKWGKDADRRCRSTIQTITRYSSRLHRCTCSR